MLLVLLAITASALTAAAMARNVAFLSSRSSGTASMTSPASASSAISVAVSSRASGGAASPAWPRATLAATEAATPVPGRHRGPPVALDKHHPRAGEQQGVRDARPHPAPADHAAQRGHVTAGRTFFSGSHCASHYRLIIDSQSAGSRIFLAVG
jgi:hypothetical protein